MTASLPFFIPPLSVELQARTLVAHNSRGIALYITGSSVNAHPLDLTFALGLQSKLAWYSAEPEGVLTQKLFANQLMSLAANHWSGGFGFDLHMLKLRMSSMTPIQQWECMTNVYRFLNQARFSGTKTERLKAMQQNDKIPQDILMRLESSLASLQQALTAKDPMMPQHLRSTHSLLISYPETVHLLDDSEIALIIDAAEVHTKTEIVKASAPTTTRRKIGAADL
jgi:hypothetical protein